MLLSAIKQMENMARYDPDIISLSQGVPSMPSDLVIREEVIKKISLGLPDRYSDPMGIIDLREVIQKKLQKRQMFYDSDEIIVSAGAVEAMATVILGLCNPGDEVVLPTPTYAAFSRILSVAHVKEVPLVLTSEKNWQLDIQDLKRNITKHTKAIILCNPNNPTGSLYPKKQLLQICALAKKHNFFIILDEVYRNMLYDTLFYTPAIESKYKKHIVRIVSFSKDFSLTGWRVGFLHTDKSIIEKILPTHDSLVNCAPVVSQYAALAALQHEERIITNHLAIYKKNREYMGQELEKLSDFLSFTWPEGSYFFFPKIKEVSDSYAFCMDVVKKEKLALVPGIDFGKAGEGHIRLCFGREFSDIKEGMKRLSHYFHTYG